MINEFQTIAIDETGLGEPLRGGVVAIGQCPATPDVEVVELELFFRINSLVEKPCSWTVIQMQRDPAGDRAGLLSLVARRRPLVSSSVAVSVAGSPTWHTLFEMISECVSPPLQRRPVDVMFCRLHADDGKLYSFTTLRLMH